MFSRNTKEIKCICDGIWRGRNPARIQELHGLLPTPAFLTSTDGCVVQSGINADFVLTHEMQQSKSMLPLMPLFTSACCCTVADSAGCGTSSALLQDRECMVSVATFCTRTNRCIVGHGIWHYPAPTLFQKPQRKFSAATLLTRRNTCTISDGVWGH